MANDSGPSGQPRRDILGSVLLALLVNAQPVWPEASPRREPAEDETIQLTLREGTNFAVARSPVEGGLVFDLQGTLWRVGAEGGPATAITDGMGDDRLPDVTPDGTRVVFQSFRRGSWDVWSVGLDGSGLEALTASSFDDREPVVSPDGRRVAFSSDRSGNYDLWLLELESKSMTRLTEHEANDTMPAWAPSGDTLFFVSDRGGTVSNQLLRLDLGDGMRETTVAVFETAIASPSVSPDGSQVALRTLDFQPLELMGSRFDQGRRSQLLLVPKDGGEPALLETPPDVFPFRAQWSSSDELVYTADGGLWRQSLGDAARAEPIRFEAVVRLDRRPYLRRESHIPDAREHLPVRGIVRPVLSPDGSMIAFSALGDIWLVDAGGGEPFPVTRDQFLDTDPAFSPDGEYLVFSSDRRGTMDLWIQELDSALGTGLRSLTTLTGAEVSPAWSPDGEQIVYLDQSSRLFIVAADGGDPRLLYAPSGLGASMPSWSSDSEHVAMAVLAPMSTRFREGHNRIAIVSTATGEARLLEEPAKSFGNRDGDGPVWSPDGNQLAFAMDGGLWLLPVSPKGDPLGRARQVVNDAADFPSFSADARSLLYLTSKGLKRVDIESGVASPIELRHQYEVSPSGGRMLLRDVRLIDGTGAAPRDHMDVLILGNRIEEIRPTGETVGEETRVVEASGKTLIPGLIEMHTHLSLPAWGSRHGVVWLSYGVTSIRSPAAAPYRFLEERESIEAGLRVGPRLFGTGYSLDGDRVYYSGALAIEEPEELQQELDRAIALDYDLIKTYVRLSDPLQKQVVQKSHEAGLFVTSHELYPAVAYGIDGIEHVKGTSRRGFSPKMTDLGNSYDDVVELIARSRVFYTPTILIYGGYRLALAREPDLLKERRLQELFPIWAQEGMSRGQAEEASDPAAVEAALADVEPMFHALAKIAERGGRILAGTDSPIVPYGLGLILEVEQLAEAGLGPIKALEAATRVAAEALGAGGELGTIEPGKLADLVLLGSDPTEDIKNLRTTEQVILNGRLVALEQILGH